MDETCKNGIFFTYELVKMTTTKH